MTAEMKPISELGMPYQAPVDVPTPGVARITANPHPVEGCPDMWLVQLGSGRDEADDEILIRPCEIPALRRVLAMVAAYVADEADEQETSR
jgi:hypothetical protein